MTNIKDVARQAAEKAQREIAGPGMLDERNRYAVVDAVALVVLDWLAQRPQLKALSEAPVSAISEWSDQIMSPVETPQPTGAEAARFCVNHNGYTGETMFCPTCSPDASLAVDANPLREASRQAVKDLGLILAPLLRPAAARLQADGTMAALVDVLRAVDEWDGAEADGLPRRLTARVKAALALVETGTEGETP